MKTKTIPGVAAILAACVALPAGAQNIDINVKPGGPGGCTIDPVQDVHIGNAASIKWHVKPASDFQFDTNGIEFVKKPGHADPPADEFQKQNSSDTTWVVLDKHKTKGKFGYDVHIKGKKTPGVQCMLDPTVFND
jgi:hypothetical protein